MLGAWLFMTASIRSCQVIGESAGSMLGRDLESLIQRAREYKKEYGDSFVSVEHLVLAFVQDQRFGKQLFKDFQISQKALKSAIEAIRGRQQVIDQGDNHFSFFYFSASNHFYLSANVLEWIMEFAWGLLVLVFWTCVTIECGWGIQMQI